MLSSCAFYAHEEQRLQETQSNKIKVALDRLDIAPGMKALDIGCGWGAMTRAIAEAGVSAVGTTRSDQQVALAQKRIYHSISRAPLNTTTKIIAFMLQRTQRLMIACFLSVCLSLSAPSVKI